MYKFADYFQQGDTESTSKFITKGGKRVDYQTSGTKLVPTDFLAPVTSHNPLRGSLHHCILLSYYFARPEALAFSKTEEQVRQVGPRASEALVKGKVFEGNRPSNSILFPLLTPATLGSLIALYEHKIFTQGVIRGINMVGACLLGWVGVYMRVC
ncbi:hypothetical protein HETIRDRAFT_165271 [Heterobasidion irregulare TC 32-1]|uniref:Glucose-6-phosphate isomerase n=1 Tax=Heterobasidion irregulare (strain TC 32-1) TaxID=747525 RepID=W4K9L7_HETIT|nr:uncharacterized protein HETIRDRAFT_165271 [Heterobasidion irregulare TC 32-1]ETW82473.1 hypothetical protein HETIRDRAFT_165271 [Heterobasidion irregulare TC 32-1]